ncbi:MAG: hypothetical protein ACHQ49_15095 [Elusimicrobiota bacterium]
MFAILAAVTLAAAAHAAPAAEPFEQSLIQIRGEALAAVSVQASLAAKEEIKKTDKNIQLTANQAWSGRSNLSNLVARAQVHGSDPMISSDLYRLEQDLDIYQQNCAVVRKQVVALAAAAVKDPALAADAKKLYEHSRILDSNAGYLAIDARNSNSTLAVAGYGGQAYQIQRLAEAGAELTPDTREAAKVLLDKITKP